MQAQCEEAPSSAVAATTAAALGRLDLQPCQQVGNRLAAGLGAVSQAVHSLNLRVRAAVPRRVRRRWRRGQPRRGLLGGGGWRLRWRRWRGRGRGGNGGRRSERSLVRGRVIGHAVVAVLRRVARPRPAARLAVRRRGHRLDVRAGPRPPLVRSGGRVAAGPTYRRPAGRTDRSRPSGCPAFRAAATVRTHPPAATPALAAGAPAPAPAARRCTTARVGPAAPAHGAIRTGDGPARGGADGCRGGNSGSSGTSMIAVSSARLGGLSWGTEVTRSLATQS